MKRRSIYGFLRELFFYIFVFSCLVCGLACVNMFMHWDVGILFFKLAGNFDEVNIVRVV